MAESSLGKETDVTRTVSVQRVMTALFTVATFALLLYTIGGPDFGGG
ncbi:hypothetical protein GCM10010278_62430 [Streptomyces melanogenes]|nr:hypothetical protein GCM10010278_62430 [Streptomyces melanogenes]